MSKVSFSNRIWLVFDALGDLFYRHQQMLHRVNEFGHIFTMLYTYSHFQSSFENF